MQLLRSARWLLLALVVTLIPVSSQGQFILSVHFGPPVLPVYEPPPCPQPDLMWTPGYWAYSADQGDYYWVPGAWVPAPYPGALWTPHYWGWENGRYIFHEGYWGRHIGYYGGVNYGYGYGGIGFAGGEWRGGHFAYNTEVIHVNETIIHNTYRDRTIVERGIVANPNHVAYAGGPGGIHHEAAPEERIAEHEQHVAKTSFQAQHESTAKSDKTSFAKNNGGHPAHLAAAKPLPEEKHAAPAEPKNEMKPGPKTETKPGPKTETKPAPKNESKPAPKTEAKPAPKTEAKPAPKTETKPAPKNEMKSVPKTEPKPAPKTEPKPAPKTETKPAPHPMPTAHPAPKPENKPAPKPEPKPKK
jgi:hypothetical protein